jgi:hypothetical protein
VPERIQLFVRGLDGRTMTFQIDQQASIANVKAMIQTKEGSGLVFLLIA